MAMVAGRIFCSVSTGADHRYREVDVNTGVELGPIGREVWARGFRLYSAGRQLLSFHYELDETCSVYRYAVPPSWKW